MKNAKYASNIQYSRLLAYFKPHKFVIMVGLLGLSLFSFVDAGMIYFIKPLIDEGLSKADSKTLQIGALLVVIIFLLRRVASFISNYAIAYTSAKITNGVRQQVFTKLQSLPMLFFDENSSGSLISKIIYDTEQISAAISNAIAVFIRETLIIVVLLCMMFYASWQLSMIFLLIGPVIALIINKVSKRFKKISTALQNTMGDITKKSEQSILAHQEILVFNTANEITAQFSDTNNKNRQQAMKLATATALSNPAIQFIASFAIAAVLLLASMEEILHSLTAGTFTMVLFVMGSILRPLKQLTNINQQLQRGLAASMSIFSLLDQKDEVDEGKTMLKDTRIDINFSDLTFYHQSAKQPAIYKFTAIIPAGKTVALVGESGSGKTTITNLLLRLYSCPSNSILINNIPIEKFTLESLRSQFSLVSQRIVLFDDTIANNITFGCQRLVSRAEIEQVAIDANVVEFAESMEAGIDSLIGENGRRLSGGQRQRIAIARALLRDAPIIILDEATSALDNTSERLMQEAFAKLSINKTMLVIAHRLSTVEKADHILVMGKGRLVEQGSHDSLLKEQGTYYQLYQKQKD